MIRSDRLTMMVVSLKGILLLKEQSWRGFCLWVLLGVLHLLGTFIKIRLMPSSPRCQVSLKVNFDLELNPDWDLVVFFFFNVLWCFCELGKEWALGLSFGLFSDVC